MCASLLFLDSEEEHEVTNCSSDCNSRPLLWRRRKMRESKGTLRSGRKKIEGLSKTKRDSSTICSKPRLFFSLSEGKNVFLDCNNKMLKLQQWQIKLCYHWINTHPLNKPYYFKITYINH
ncbi:hypothetical protein AMECASPLE_009275 [Ameca splendens]|uniref:Uncharacterized protein n=1 Tax=Ameca splendens TaxID=208324 RepID=A0ABV1A6H2_9TELE